MYTQSLTETQSQTLLFFNQSVSSILALLPLFTKHKARTHWYCQPFGQIYKYQIQEKILFKKEWRETITTN